MIERKKKILLIDDDEIVNIMHQRVIKKSEVPCEVLVALNGSAAIQLLDEHVAQNISLPDLIFLDINMPRMGGYEFLEEYTARSLGGVTKKRIIMLSSSLSPADQERAISNPNVYSFSDKTMSPEDFLRLVNMF